MGSGYAGTQFRNLRGYVQSTDRRSASSGLQSVVPGPTASNITGQKCKLWGPSPPGDSDGRSHLRTPELQEWSQASGSP